MSDYLGLCYAAFLTASLIIFFAHRKILNRRRGAIGTIKGQWSTLFNLTFPLNRLRWTAVFVYLAGNVYWLMKAAASKGPHYNFMLVAILISLAPRWQVIIGAKGMIFKMKIILWKDISQKKIVCCGKNGRRRYILITNSFLPSSKPKTIRIPLPARIKFDLDEFQFS